MTYDQVAVRELAEKTPDAPDGAVKASGTAKVGVEARVHYEFRLDRGHVRVVIERPAGSTLYTVGTKRTRVVRPAVPVLPDGAVVVGDSNLSEEDALCKLEEQLETIQAVIQHMTGKQLETDVTLSVRRSD